LCFVVDVVAVTSGLDEQQGTPLLMLDVDVLFLKNH
jgi:hypothetical protein